MIWVFLILAIVVFITVFHLRGHSLDEYDSPPGQSFDAGHEPSDEHGAVVASPARLQSWAHVVHVWHMFYPQLTEARDAWDEIGKFIAGIDAESDRSGEDT